jgi:hypothetical protein
MMDNLFFVIRYLRSISKQGGATIQLASIEESLKNIFAGVSVVGDKNPDYVFSLARFVREENLLVILIYRDPRDVVSSAKIAYRDKYQRWWGEEMRSSKEIAKRWVYGIDLMQRYSNQIFTIQYEDFVMDPQKNLRELGERVNLDWKDFYRQRIRTDSVGKHKQFLTDQDYEDIIQIAGAKMETLGYKL